MNESRLLVTNPTTGQVDVPLSDFCTIEQSWENVIGSPDLSGGPFHLPGRDGAEFAPFEVGPRVVSLGVALRPRRGSMADMQQVFNASLRGLGRLLWSPQAPLTLTRVVDGADDVGWPRLDRHIGEAVLTSDGFTPAPENMIYAKLVLKFILLPGYWRDRDASSVNLASGVPSTVVVDSCADTTWVQVTLTGGNNPSITNAATGVTLAYAGTPAAAVLDVHEGTAVDAGVDVRSKVTSDDVWWLRLAPGPNQLTLSGGGTAVVSWRGVWL